MSFLKIILISSFVTLGACGAKKKETKKLPPPPVPRKLQAKVSVEILLAENGIDTKTKKITTKEVKKDSAKSDKMEDCSLEKIELNQGEVIGFKVLIENEKQKLELKKGNGNNNLIPKINALTVEKSKTPPIGKWTAKTGKEETLIKSYIVEISSNLIKIEMGCEKPNPAAKK